MALPKPHATLALLLTALTAACSTAPLLPTDGRRLLAQGPEDATPPQLQAHGGSIEGLWIPCVSSDLPPGAARGLSAVLPAPREDFVGGGRWRGRYRGIARYGPSDARGAVVEADGALWARWHQIDPADAPAAVAATLARDPEARLLALFFVQGGGGPDRYRAELQPRRGPFTLLEIGRDGRVLRVRHRVAAELEFAAPR